MAELFGWEFRKKQNPNLPPPGAKSFIATENDDGATVVQAGGFFGSYIDLEGDLQTEISYIQHYRNMALHPEIEIVVDEITNECVVYDKYKGSVKLDLDMYDQPVSVKKKIHEEFDTVLNLLDFNNKGYDIFRKWYIDGRIYFHIIVDEKHQSDGIIELRPIDPTRIKKIRKEKKEKGKDGVEIVTDVEEFYFYDPSPENKTYPNPYMTTQGIKISPDAICYVNSGLFDANKKIVIGFLHKAVKSLNQVRMIEDAIVIYRISRAPERRVFYIDVGSLPKTKAEQYMKDIMNRYRNKLVYDASTGEIKDDRRHMSMLEDYWLPRREGGRGTEINTLDGAKNLNEIDDLLYFQKKLYRSLNIPASRMDDTTGFNMGKSSEITRDELRFFKFVERLRKKFSTLFMDLLKVQLLLKNIITPDDWKELSQTAAIIFNKDSYFTELKETELLKIRMEALRDIHDHIGVFFSKKWIQKKILHLSDEEVELLDSQIKKENAQESNQEQDKQPKKESSDE